MRWLSLLIGFAIITVTVPVASEPAASFPLGPDVTATLDEAGVLRVVHDGTDGPVTLLACDWSRPTNERALDAVAHFLQSTYEGATGGRRGFARDADDDHDDLVDEDRLDGIDNDGDGLIDEDYAAVGHAMTAWHETSGGTARHLEAYHWSYPTLSTIVALVADATEGSTTDPLRLVLPGGGRWLAGDEICTTSHTATNMPIFLARRSAAAGDVHWLGVVLLDAHYRPRAEERIRANDAQLLVPLLAGRQELALAWGPTRLQVLHDLLRAPRLQAGATDPMSHEQVPWLPPPPQRAVEAPTVTITSPNNGSGYQLSLALNGEGEPRLDPDGLRADGRHLGPVVGMIWQPETGEVRPLPWSPTAVLTGTGCHPYAALTGEGPGTLVFEMAGDPPATSAALTASLLDGRSVVLPLRSDPIPAEPTTLVDEENDKPALLMLSPSLLSSYPNPFRFTTQVSYQVPATAGEAFDLSDPEAPVIDPVRLMPYASNPPPVTVTIFSLEGRAIATLQSGRLAVGTYEVSWNGCDEQGRTLPSGAYFCRLEVDQWSVTKRLIFVR